MYLEQSMTDHKTTEEEEEAFKILLVLKILSYDVRYDCMYV